MFFLAPPSDARVRALLKKVADAPFTHEPIGASCDELVTAPDGFVLDRYATELGKGAEVFERGRAALCRIDNYPPSFTRVVHLDPEAEVAEGGLFATVARHYGFASVHPCRILYVVDEARRFGFGFGTLPGHAESGEERFFVDMDASGLVTYDVQAFSRPHALLARLGAPIARRLQLRFQTETLETMRRHCGA